MVWFEVTPTVSGPMTISTCHPATTYDTVLQVWQGGDNGCDFMQLVDCNDDTDLSTCLSSCNGAIPRSSQVTIDAVANVLYRFSIGSFGANSAGCPLCLGVIVTIGKPCGDPPVNLDCTLAKELPGTAGIHEAAVDVTDAVVLPSEPIPDCGFNVGHTVWFKVVPEVSGPLTFSTCHSNTTYDTVIQAYTGDCTGLLKLDCNDDFNDPACNNNCNGQGATVSFLANAGQTYYFQVGSFNHNADGCVLCLGVSLTIVDICAEETTPPVTELALPSALTCVCDPVILTGTAEDPNGTFESYTLDYRPASGGSWTVIQSSNTAVTNGVLGTWNAAALPQGYYAIRLTARNICGLSSTDVKVLWLGTTFDTLRIDSPTSGAVLGGNICVSGTAWDSFCYDTFSVEYQPLGGGSWNSLTTVNNSSTRANQVLAIWDTVGDGIPDGDYRIRASGYDTCGNTKVETVEPVMVDNTPTVAFISSPTNCEFVSGSVQIVGTVNDAHLRNWTVQYTGGPVNHWTTIATGTTPVSNGVLANWDTTVLPFCAYLIRLLAWDEAVVNCSNTGIRQSEYTVSVVVGQGFSADLNGDGKVNIIDLSIFASQWMSGT